MSRGGHPIKWENKENLRKEKQTRFGGGKKWKDPKFECLKRIPNYLCLGVLLSEYCNSRCSRRFLDRKACKKYPQKILASGGFRFANSRSRCRESRLSSNGRLNNTDTGIERN